MKRKKIFSIILARKNSKGIKNKNLKTINNKPLLYWSITKSLNSKFINKTFVSSDSQKILNYSKKVGAETILRPYKYAKDKTTSEKSLLHSINYLERKKFEFDTVVFIQPTSPIRKKNDFDEAIKKFNFKKLDSLFSANVSHDTNFWEIKKKLLKANYNYKKRKMRQDLNKKYLENGSFYIFDKEKFKKEKCRLFGKIDFYLIDKLQSFQIDDASDIKLINLIFKL
tara:strand:+ start:3528 stop:4205 length:678 start_codon:yes stop_codon:yes gene_type:complete